MKSDRNTPSHLKASLCLTVLIVSILAAGGAFAQTPGTPQKTGAAKAARTNDNRAPLALSEYLSQVSEKHTGYKAADEAARAAKLYSEEGKLLFRPSLSANGTAYTDGQANPFGSGSDRSRVRSYSLGVAQQTDFGLSGKLSYNMADIESPTPGIGQYKPGWAQLDLSQQLLRNWGGRESRAQQEALTSSALAKSFGQSYATKAILLEAEAAYWRLALARELVQVQKDAVERAARISEWTNRRVRLQLADKAELLQASTNLQARRLELRNAEDEERAASQAFNSSRGLSSDKVDERLDSISPELIAKMNAPARTNTRDDVKSAEFQAKASTASSILARERNTPTLELFASAPLNEPSDFSPLSVGNALLQPRMGTTLGVRLNAPLDFGTLSKAREGYSAEAAAADLTYQRKVFEEERDWSDLTAKFKQAKQRLELYRELESTQKQKLDYERDRHQRGRTTLQQVLFFETDYEQAQLGRIRTLAEILTLNAQMKLYGVSYESR